MSAVLQFEASRDRIDRMKRRRINLTQSFAPDDARAIAHAALQDVFDNAGTLVVVVSEDKITIVQRATAEEV